MLGSWLFLPPPDLKCSQLSLCSSTPPPQLLMLLIILSFLQHALALSSLCPPPLLWPLPPLPLSSPASSTARSSLLAFSLCSGSSQMPVAVLSHIHHKTSPLTFPRSRHAVSLHKERMEEPVVWTCAWVHSTHRPSILGGQLRMATKTSLLYMAWPAHAYTFSFRFFSSLF